MSLITPFPEAESPALDRFALHDRDGIAALLRQLGQRGSLLTLYFDDASGFTVGNVLAVDTEGDAFVLDCAGDGGVQRAIALSRDIVVVAFLDATKIQFTLAGAEPVDHEGRPALRLRLPRRLLRIQRRSAPRRAPQGGRPATCRVPIPGKADQYEPVRVLDISLGGMAVLATPSLFELSRDEIVGPCHLDLPDVGQIGVALRVRYLEAWPSETGQRRCGCEFVDLGDGARRSLQRYLDRLEAKARAGTDVRAA